jgi:hypothetical protein
MAEAVAPHELPVEIPAWDNSAPGMITPAMMVDRLPDDETVLDGGAGAMVELVRTIVRPAIARG